METFLPVLEMVDAWSVDEEDSTRVHHGRAVRQLPGEPCRQIDDHLALAKLRYHQEQGHVEVSHQDIRVVGRDCEPIKEFLQSRWPDAIREVAVEVDDPAFVRPAELPY